MKRVNQAQQGFQPFMLVIETAAEARLLVNLIGAVAQHDAEVVAGNPVDCAGMFQALEDFYDDTATGFDISLSDY